MARVTVAPSKPSLLFIATGDLPRRSPACAHQPVKVEDRGGWFRVSCTRGTPTVCQWAANYEVKP